MMLEVSFSTAKRAAITVTLLAAMSGRCFAVPPAVVTQYHAIDIMALDRSSTAAATKEERSFALGAAFAFRHKDAMALDRLLPVAHSAADLDLRAAAYLALSDVYLRNGRFGACDSAMRSASKFSETALDSGALQTMEFAHALIAEQPMHVVEAGSGRLEATRDKAGLLRVPIVVNGHGQIVVADTGAGFSTISETTAKRLGIRMLNKVATVGSSTKAAVATRLGIASSLRFGNVLLSNVVFIVLPDAALTFSDGFKDGPYKIDAIVGLPVFLMLGRIEIRTAGAKVSFVYGDAVQKRPAVAGQTDPNLLLSGVEPLVLVRATGAPSPLRMFIDSGANATMFYANIARDAPSLMTNAVAGTVRQMGAGGSTIDANAKELPDLTLSVAGRAFHLKDISVSSDDKTDRDGVIGQDLLRQGSRTVMDFDRMHFAIEK